LLSSDLRLPLNIDNNPWREAVALLKSVRRKAWQDADQLPIVLDGVGDFHLTRRAPEPRNSDRLTTDHARTSSLNSQFCVR
jgi:hypothetical protein